MLRDGSEGVLRMLVLGVGGCEGSERALRGLITCSEKALRRFGECFEKGVGKLCNGFERL